MADLSMVKTIGLAEKYQRKVIGKRISELIEYCGIYQYEVGIGIEAYEQSYNEDNDTIDVINYKYWINKYHENGERPKQFLVNKIVNGERDGSLHAKALAFYFTNLLSEKRVCAQNKNPAKTYYMYGQYSKILRQSDNQNFGLCSIVPEYFTLESDYINEPTREKREEYRKQRVSFLIQQLVSEMYEDDMDLYMSGIDVEKIVNCGQFIKSAVPDIEDYIRYKVSQVIKKEEFYNIANEEFLD